jgi:hypothetical protein
VPNRPTRSTKPLSLLTMTTSRRARASSKIARSSASLRPRSRTATALTS